jgi:hypothetical protein
VEGFESRVLAGAKQTLSDHKPLLYIEGANRVATVVEILEGNGCRYGTSATTLSGCRTVRLPGWADFSCTPAVWMSIVGWSCSLISRQAVVIPFSARVRAKSRHGQNDHRHALAV